MPVLDRDRSAERLDEIQAALGDRLGVVEEPAVVAGEATVGGDPVEDVEIAFDRLAVGRVDAERPVVVDQQANRGFEVGGRAFGELGPRLGEVLEVDRRQRQHLAGAVRAQPLVALPGP